VNHSLSNWPTSISEEAKFEALNTLCRLLIQMGKQPPLDIYVSGMSDFRSFRHLRRLSIPAQAMDELQALVTGLGS
jgi:hypothetical protein